MRTAIFLGAIYIASSVRSISKVMFNETQVTVAVIFLLIFLACDIYEAGNKKD